MAGQSDAVVPRTRVGGMYMRECIWEWNHPHNDSETIDVEGKTRVTPSHEISLLTGMNVKYVTFY